MPSVDRRSLFGKLNDASQQVLLDGVNLCKRRLNDYVEIEHLLACLLDRRDGDIPAIFEHYGLDLERARSEAQRALDRFPRRSSSAPPGWGAEIEPLVVDAWMLTTIKFNAPRIRTAYLLTALLSDRNTQVRAQQAVPTLKNLSGEKLQQEVRLLIGNSTEEEPDTVPGVAASGGMAMPGEPPRAAADSKTPSLDQYTLNLTERAKKGEIDPVIGRDFEIRQVIDILMRRRQNNPILTGEAGVGKTAVVEGFALQIVSGDVPPPLKNVVVRTLDLGLLQAGAGVKGEFENRLKSVIQEVKASPVPIILFIDEAHTLIGAGGQAGQGDAANLLKPALARGELRTVAATTWMEYKKYFEGDPALKRRFQVVKVDEPSVDSGVLMMRGVAGTMEKHHKVRVLDEAVIDAVKLSQRYITDRQLPDKSVSLLDTACARVALSQAALPSPIEDCRRELQQLDLEAEILDRESAVGADHRHRRQEIVERKQLVQERLTALEKRWEMEKKLVEQLKDTFLQLSAGKLTTEDRNKLQAEFIRQQKELEKTQGEEPLVLPFVGSQAIAEVVASWTGIPVGKMVTDEIQAVLKLKDTLRQRVIGQDHALEVIAQRIRTARANLTDPRKPVGVFLLVGPSGVGKTETALALADILYGGDRNMIVINMSEYKESSKISNLTGSAKGLVGYGEPGALTDPVRRKPYSVVLLDEVEKAHGDVQELFYQVFDKGMLMDSSGNEVNFKNTIILLTSNVGTDTIAKLCADPETMPDSEGLGAALRPDLLKAFKPALLGRMQVVPYFPLSDEVLRGIIQLQLRRVADRVRDNHRATFTYDDALVATIASRCKEVESGARNVEHILSGTLLPELASEFLARMVEGQLIGKAHVTVGQDGKFAYQVS